jgi:hypothetical protein
MPTLARPGGLAPEPVTSAEGETTTPEAPTLLDVIWPKKEDLTQVKWSVALCSLATSS